VTRGTTLIQHRRAARSHALTAPIAVGGRMRLLGEGWRTKDEGWKSLSYSSFIFHPASFPFTARLGRELPRASPAADLSQCPPLSGRFHPRTRFVTAFRKFWIL